MAERMIVIPTVFGDLEVEAWPLTLPVATKLRNTLDNFIDKIEERRPVSSEELRAIAVELHRSAIKFTDEASRRSGKGMLAGMLAGYDIQERLAGHVQQNGSNGSATEVNKGLMDLAQLTEDKI